MTSIIETIKAKVDVVEEIGLVVALQKSGKSFKGLCPFHNERTPSFYVFGESQTWRCFGCNEGGDVFTFVQMQQGLEFREALLYLLGQGYTESELVSGGLARMRDGGIGDSGGTGIGGGIYDYFRHRLIFPIRDTRSRVIGFGGRAFGDAQPKYLNSPQTLLFEKN